MELHTLEIFITWANEPVFLSIWRGMPESVCLPLQSFIWGIAESFIEPLDAACIPADMWESE